MGKWTGGEIKVGVAHNQVSGWDTQAPYLLRLGVISTPSTLMQIYYGNQSAGRN